MKINIATLYEFNKKYKDLLPIILLVPTIIGGLWQIIELLIIDPAFIRFFSVTQLIPDGILILTVIIIFYLMYKLLDYRYEFKNFFEVKNETDRFNFWELLDGLSIMLVPILVLVLINDQTHYTRIITNDTRILSILSIIFFFFLILPIILKGLQITIVEILKLLAHKKPIFLKKILENLVSGNGIVYNTIYTTTSFFYIYAFLGLLILFSISIYQLRKKILFPNNFENLIFIKQNLNDRYGIDKFKIRYLNDKYIFIQIIDVKEDINDLEDSKILILKFDEIIFK